VLGKRSIGGAGNLSQTIDGEDGAEAGVRLKGAVALVTGASSGIGRATAIELADAGCRVALAARRADRLEETAVRCREAGGEVLVRPTDVAKRQECFELVAEVTSMFGRVDILVNNAGFALLDRIESAHIDDVRRMIDTNLLGAFHCTQAVLPQMLERRDGDGNVRCNQVRHDGNDRISPGRSRRPRRARDPRLPGVHQVGVLYLRGAE
jgi:NAD(P)-dependent dehydrogenase (short-subunit alcohol dehydrogenase family)